MCARVCTSKHGCAVARSRVCVCDVCVCVCVCRNIIIVPKGDHGCAENMCTLIGMLPCAHGDEEQCVRVSTIWGSRAGRHRCSDRLPRGAKEARLRATRGRGAASARAEGRQRGGGRGERALDGARRGAGSARARGRRSRSGTKKRRLRVSADSLDYIIGTRGTRAGAYIRRREPPLPIQT